MLPTNWSHRRDHSVHSLFRRQESDIDKLPAVGSPGAFRSTRFSHRHKLILIAFIEWTAKYPTTDPYANTPQQWLDALKDAVASGAVPNIPRSVLKDGTPFYGDLDPNGPEICSGTFQCRGKNEIWDAPDNMIGLSVDDGPVSEAEASPRLYDFLKEQNQKITHFMIGTNIRDNPQVFLRAFKELEDDIAVHTWSHPYMTTLTNEQIVAELGWTLQIIHDSTEGRVPRYWRPPFGDADTRVRAIASEVFGLTSVIWNRDTEDFSLSTGGTTLEKIQDQFKEWLAGPRSPGLIILEHEIEGGDITAFINALPLIRSHKEWTAVSCAQLFENQPNGTWYLNAQNNTSPVKPINIGVKEASGPSSAKPKPSSSPLPTSSSTPARTARTVTPVRTALTITPARGATSTKAKVTSTPAETKVIYTPAVEPAAPTDTQPPAAVGADSTTTQVISTTRATSANTQTTGTSNANNAVARPNAAGVAIAAPSHLGLSLVITVLSVLGGSALL